MEKELGRFFKLLQDQFKASAGDIYIDDAYDFKKATTQLLIKVTDPALVRKIASNGKLLQYKFTATGDAFKTTKIVNVKIQKSGGIRGSGKLPKKGESLKNPSTAQQELGTIYYFEEKLKGVKEPCKELISKKAKFGFDSDWMYSFEQQWLAFSKNIKVKPNSKILLDSAKNDSDIIVDLAKEFGLVDLKDNWNPADIWVMCISQQAIRKETSNIKTLEEYNSWLEQKFESREIVGVSLKKVSPNKKGKFEIVQAKDLPQVDLEMDKTIFNPMAKNFIYMTKGEPSGFQLRIGYKASSITKESDVRIYLEGRQKGSAVQLGGVSSKMFPEFAKEYGFNIQQDKNRIFKDPKKYLDDNLPRLLKNKNIVNKTSEMPENTLQLTSAAWLTYYLDIMITGGPELAKDCYYSAIKKNKYSSIHCKVS